VCGSHGLSASRWISFQVRIRKRFRRVSNCPLHVLTRNVFTGSLCLCHHSEKEAFRIYSRRKSVPSHFKDEHSLTFRSSTTWHTTRTSKRNAQLFHIQIPCLGGQLSNLHGLVRYLPLLFEIPVVSSATPNRRTRRARQFHKM
jgi:hypothetical protein